MTVAVKPPAAATVRAEPCLTVRGLTKRYGGPPELSTLD